MQTVFIVIAGVLVAFWILGMVRRVVRWTLHLVLLLAAAALVIAIVAHG